MMLSSLAAREVAAEESDAAATNIDTLAGRGIDFLRSSQNAEGYYTNRDAVGITALITTGILRHGRTPEDPVVAKSLAWLESHQQSNGGIFSPQSTHGNYETCLAIMCFQAANRDGRYNDLLAKAEKYVKGAQWDEGEGHDPSSLYYGGAGYGRSERPDLSNTAFLIEALHELGRGPDDEAIQRALVFVNRCQNLESELNPAPFAAKNPDGGFYYTVAAGGQSQAGETPAGGLRSYASMTYAGLKSMIYAGVDSEDPRVKAAIEWIGQHYTLDSNPGMEDAGLFYYYNTFGKALEATGLASFKDAGGESHDWRRELIETLAARQHENGSWTNSNPRWLEGDPNLATGYALLALAHCRSASEPSPK
jgi:squalene-hopene/tetraprenyl-beta-curcumene cyclase